jgi:hypothetical protein
VKNPLAAVNMSKRLASIIKEVQMDDNELASGNKRYEMIVAIRPETSPVNPALEVIWNIVGYFPIDEKL